MADITRDELNELIRRLGDAKTAAAADLNFGLVYQYAPALTQLQAWLQRGMEGSAPVNLDEVRGWLDPTKVKPVLTTPPPESLPAAPRSVARTDQSDGQKRFDEGRRRFREGKLRLALELFDAAQRLDPSVRVEVEDQIVQLKKQLPKDIDAALQRGRDQIERGDLPGAEETFNQVIEDLDASNKEARFQLGRIVELKSQRSLEQELLNAKDKLKSPKIGDIESSLNTLRTLKGNPAQNSEIAALIAEAEILRTTTLSRTGVVETHRADERYREAIVDMEKLIHEGLRDYRRSDGQIVRPEDELNQLRVDYTNFCKKKAGERLNEAKRYLPAAPRAAQGRLEDALKTLEQLPNKEKTMLEAELETVKEQVRVWDQADQAVNEGTALLGTAPDKALEKFIQAQARYPGYANTENVSIEAMLADAKSRIAKGILRQAQEAFDSAYSNFRMRNLTDALNDNSRAQQLLQGIEDPGAEVKALQTQIRNLLDEIAEANKEDQQAREAAERLTQKIGEIEKLVAAGSLTVAKQLIDRLSPEERRDPRVEPLDLKITLTQSDQGKLSKAKEMFEQGQWKQAIAICEQITEDSLKSDAVQLTRRAQAAMAFGDGKRALAAFEWERAEGSFQTVINLGGEQATEARGLKEQIAGKKAADDEICAALKRAQTYHANQRFKEAWQTIKPYRSAVSSVQKDILLEISKLREDWSPELRVLIEQKIEADDLDQARNLAATLCDDLGSKLDDDYALKARAELKAHQKRADALKKLGKWAEAEKEFQAIQQNKPDDPEIELQAREVIKRSALERAHTALWTDNDPNAAIRILETAQRGGSDKEPDLLIELAQLCLEKQPKDYEQARRYARQAQNLDPAGKAAQMQERIQLEENLAMRLDEAETALTGREWQSVSTILKDLEATDSANLSRETTTRIAQLKQQAVKKLVEQARLRKNTAAGSELVELMQIYVALKNIGRLEEQREADRGLASLKSQLPRIAENLITKAREFRIVGKPALELYEQARELYGQIQAFVEEGYKSLPNTPETKDSKERLETALNAIAVKRDKLKLAVDRMASVNAFLASLDQNEALPANDKQVFDDKMFAANRELLRDVRINADSSIVGLTDLGQALDVQENKWSETHRLLARLRELLNLQATERDAFETTQQVCREILRADPKDRFGLQKRAQADWYDEFLKGRVASVQQHMTLAGERLANLDELTTWSQSAEDKEKEAQNLALQAQSALKKEGLAKSSELWSQASDAALAAQRTFGQPPQPAKSHPAQMLVDDGKERTRASSDLGELVALTGKQKQEMAGKLEQLKTSLQEIFALLGEGKRLKQVEELLQKAFPLDPLNEDLARAQRTLKAIRARKNTRLNSLLRREEE